MSQTDILIRAVNSANCLAAVAIIIIGGPHERVEGNPGIVRGSLNRIVTRNFLAQF